MRINNLLKFVIAVVISEMAGVIGAIFTTPSIQGWYSGLAKPPLNPPGWVFGPVWTTLYFLIGVSLFLVWKRDWRVVNHFWEKRGKPWNPISEKLWTGEWKKINIIAIFTAQYILNILWSVIFFGLHRPDFAFFAIIGLWISIIYLMINFYRVSKLAAWLLVPYIVWVSFAVYLNYAIWVLN